ncbi:MAG: hypothetical protein H0W83_05845 [Planctomycetes bacterium]|nr:hypothetical protein [Planctomycetota bacterium]
MFSDSPDQNFSSQRLLSLNAERVDLERRLSTYDVLMQQLRKARSADGSKRLEALSSIEAIAANPRVTLHRNELYELQAKQLTLSQKYLDRHPRMIEASNMVDSATAHLTESVEAVAQEIESEHARIDSELGALKEKIVAGEHDLTIYRENLVRLQSMTEQTKSQQMLYETLMKNLSEQNISSRLDVQQVTVIDPPRARDGAVNVKLPLFLVATLFLGLAAGFTASLAATGLDRRIVDSPALSSFAQLGKIPYVAGGPVIDKDGIALSPSSLAESFHSAQANLRQLMKQGQFTNLCVAVVSCSPEEGRSFVASRLAISLASNGLKVLLVDADFRLPTQHEHFGIDKARGLGPLLSGELGIAPVPTRFANLEILPSGGRIANPAQILNSPCLDEWLGHIRRFYNVILFDTASLATADPIILGEHMDEILLVVNEGRLTKDDLRNGLDKLKLLQSKMLGVIYNGGSSHS